MMKKRKVIILLILLILCFSVLFVIYLNVRDKDSKTEVENNQIEEIQEIIE